MGIVVEDPPVREKRETWSATPCLALGLLFLAGGFYFLITSGTPVPNTGLEGLGVALPREVVNLQRLAFGQTFTISGAVFLAVGLRPR
ncbi:MAG TPA: hypothetical protein VFS40_15980 [Gemmatimonadales bacterium]|nr:hypothetical protein [Gemmatimonadales bacterium]